jgi:glycosyltransferase involved in cell wall biosynthesis
VIPSKTIQEELLKKFPDVKNKLKVIYNFLDPSFIEKCSQKSESIIKDDYILFIGNRKKHKNLRNLILAYSMIKDEIKCKLVIAGSKDKGKEEDEIDFLIRKKGLSDHVIQIISPSDDVIINLYQHAKLFVFPSFYEGFGYPPLEALCCNINIPLILSDISVLREIYGDIAIFFNPKNPEDLAKKIKLMDRNNLKQIERRRILSQYTWKVHAEKIIEILSNTLK